MITFGSTNLNHMKKLIYIAVLLFGVGTMTSCVKEYTCQCKISFSGKPGLPEPYIREYSVTNTLKEAEQECANRSRSYVEDGVTTTEDCELY